jgi:serine/threonine protein kinase
MPASTKEFLLRVRKSRLVEAKKLDDVLSRISVEDMDVIPIARSLIRAGLLTKWQCQQILDGRYKGFLLGKYKLLDQLGRGGMSMVYVAEHTGMRRKVALKVLPKSRVNDASFLERFCIEAQASAALDHPNIVRAFDFDSQGDTYYLVMEHIEGRNLRDIVIEDGPLSFDRAANTIRQSALGLQHAHDAGMVHRDIKPANLLVDNQGRVKLLDLGLALLSQADTSSVTLDHDEKVLGTADYLAPEQALSSHHVDARADIYALGCTLYFAITGHPPYPDGSIAQKIARHQTAPPPDPREAREDCPKALANLCLEMMQKDPADRMETAERVAAALEAWLANPAKFTGPTNDTGSAEDTLGFATESTGSHAVGEPPELQFGSGAADVMLNENDVALAVKRPSADPDLRRTRRKRGFPLWLWFSLLALLGATTWMAVELMKTTAPR